MAAESGLEAAAVRRRSRTCHSRRGRGRRGGRRRGVAGGGPSSARSPLRRALAFDFFQAMHLLDRLQPERTRDRRIRRSRQEIVRLRRRRRASLFRRARSRGSRRATATAAWRELLRAHRSAGRAAARLQPVRRRGARARRRSRAQGFLGIFRSPPAVAVLSRVGEDARQRVARRSVAGRWLTRSLLDLVGLGSDGAARSACRSPTRRCCSTSDCCRCRRVRRSASSRCSATISAFPVTVEQFVGAWYPLERAAQSELGDDASASSQLGLGAVAGDEIWDQQSRARVGSGPLSRHSTISFLPGGSAYDAAARACALLYTNDQFDFEIQLVLDRRDSAAVPARRRQPTPRAGAPGSTAWAGPCSVFSCRLTPSRIAPRTPQEAVEALAYGSLQHLAPST